MERAIPLSLVQGKVTSGGYNPVKVQLIRRKTTNVKNQIKKTRL